MNLNTVTVKQIVKGGE